ncbi:MAG: prepilin peptidase [Candidatus Muiribacterium halophilum]|uniref:Prepilin leader peptidase/N-methyltransferase n=1 Tax=Muiribacterium halophilum TaxID=2053465 RepID=A0A2N5ZIB2_MUIH1|nr:MAG: prepilin peptidase [Candidatus Muirbacterium halophilum]
MVFKIYLDTMEIYFYSHVFFIFGLLVGSFLNVCIYRMPLGKSVVFPGSACMRCGTFLKAKDLFPVLSHLFTGGICRYCGSVVSFRYSFVELLTACLFVMAFITYGFTPYTIFLLIIISYMIIISFIDLDYLIIPDGMSIGLIVVGYMFNFLAYFFLSSEMKELLHYDLTLYDPILGMLAGGGILFLISFFSGGGMGGGDIKLMAGIGALFGLRFTLVVMLFSFLIGALMGIILIITRIKKRKDYVPFGPYIAIATIIVAFIGSSYILELVKQNYWYVGF